MGVTNSVTLSSDETAHEVLEWIDTLISNCKKFIDGTYHGRQEHKQLYLEEFVYWFNRRGSGSSLVDRLLNTCAFTKEHPRIPVPRAKTHLAYASL